VPETPIDQRRGYMTERNDRYSHTPPEISERGSTTALGQVQRLPPVRLNDCFDLSEATFVGTAAANGNAPKADIRANGRLTKPSKRIGQQENMPSAPAAFMSPLTIAPLGNVVRLRRKQHLGRAIFDLAVGMPPTRSGLAN